MRTALVTGAVGFLGRYIVRELAARRWRVLGMDRRFKAGAGVPRPCRRNGWGTDSRTGNASAPHPSLREERGTAQPCPLADFQQIELPAPDLDRWIAAWGPRVIVHAAGPSSVPDSVEHPARDFHDSVATLLSVLEAIRRAERPCRIVFLSSAAVYGNPSRLPVAEEAPPDPISPYGFHKLMCENLIREYRNVYGVRGCSVRIFSAYGPGLRRQVLWDLTQKILHPPPARASACACSHADRLHADRVVELLGTGQETRDFVHAADVARGIGTVMERGAFNAEVYNLATGRETSIRSLAQMLADALCVGSCKPGLGFSGTRRVGDPTRWCADIRRLAALGYAARYSIHEGVVEYAGWAANEVKPGSARMGRSSGVPSTPLLDSPWP